MENFFKSKINVLFQIDVTITFLKFHKSLWVFMIQEVLGLLRQMRCEMFLALRECTI